jgi:hypothetical protein
MKFYEFLAIARQDEVDAEMALRQWARSIACTDLDLLKTVESMLA